MSVYYNFSQVNNTDEPVLLNKTDFRLSPILDVAENYELQISKFTLPSQSIQTYIIPDDSEEYKIRYSCLTNGPANDPDYTIVSYEQSLFKQSEYKMYSANDFAENFNRASLLCYKNLLNALHPTYGNVNTQPANGTFTRPGTTAYHDIPFTFSTFKPGTRVGYIKLDGRLYNNTTDQCFELQLISPGGTRNIIYSNKIVNADSYCTFEDGSLNSVTDVVEALKGSLQPVEAFVAQAEATECNGTWTLRVFNKNTGTVQDLKGVYDLQLTLYGCPRVNTANAADDGNDMYFPRHSPSLAIDGSSLVLCFDQSNVRSSFTIGVSPKLYQVLGFKGTKYNGYYNITIPQTLGISDAVVTISQYVQPNSTVYRMLDVSEIVILSSTLPIQGESNSVDSAPIVMSINTTSGDLNPSIYEFYSVNSDDRSYSLTTSASISILDFSVYVRYRNTNRIEPVYLSPYSVFNMLIKFKPISS